eukprot:gnl/TRDRNA2_/TRDRNA2_134963_c0_seq1.p1 gnl/TRDRNA2_/TRDRNA2_134963_c0~~gnl/TRDRNA2_/TRDRNA2_134963_c0_seq1.p1  ORF type:complete len:595 (-),score=83.20 gnl/TRDRNA2_/TRDRNA2_134963_c0_seq1:31-1734(-)
MEPSRGLVAGPSPDRTTSFQENFFQIHEAAVHKLHETVPSFMRPLFNPARSPPSSPQEDESVLKPLVQAGDQDGSPLMGHTVCSPDLRIMTSPVARERSTPLSGTTGLRSPDHDGAPMAMPPGDTPFPESPGLRHLQVPLEFSEGVSGNREGPAPPSVPPAWSDETLPTAGGSGGWVATWGRSQENTALPSAPSSAEHTPDRKTLKADASTAAAKTRPVLPLPASRDASGDSESPPGLRGIAGMGDSPPQPTGASAQSSGDGDGDRASGRGWQVCDSEPVSPMPIVTNASDPTTLASPAVASEPLASARSHRQSPTASLEVERFAPIAAAQPPPSPNASGYAKQLAAITRNAPDRLAEKLADQLQQYCVDEAGQGLTSFTWDVPLPGRKSFIQQVAREFARRVEALGFERVEWGVGRDANDWRESQGRFNIIHDTVCDRYYMRLRVHWPSRPLKDADDAMHRQTSPGAETQVSLVMQIQQTLDLQRQLLEQCIAAQLNASALAEEHRCLDSQVATLRPPHPDEKDEAGIAEDSIVEASGPGDSAVEEPELASSSDEDVEAVGLSELW